MGGTRDDLQVKVDAVLARGERLSVTAIDPALHLNLAENVARQATAWRSSSLRANESDVRPHLTEEDTA